MPQVPYQPYPTERPSPMGAPTRQIDVSDVAFGGATARATEKFGATVSHVGDELFNRALALQELQNQTDARNAQVDFADKSSQVFAKFRAEQGENAGPDQLMKVNGELKALREQIRGGLKTDHARKDYDAQSLGFMSREMFNNATHSGYQMKVSADHSVDAAINLEYRTITSNPDEATLESSTRRLQELAAQRTDIRGWGPEEHENYLKDLQSKAYAHMVQGKSKTDPWVGKELLEKYRDKITNSDDLAKVEYSVQQQIHSTVTRVEADNITRPIFGKPEEEWPSLTDLKAKGAAWAEKYDPKDKMLPQSMERAIEAKYLAHQRDVRDKDMRDALNMRGAMMGVGSEDGRRPTDKEELFKANPEMEALWNSASRKKQLDWESDLVKNARDPYPPSLAGDGRFYYLQGLLGTDKQAEIMDINPLDEKMPRSQQAQIARWQQRIHSRQDQDHPGVTRALNELNGVMAQTGVKALKAQNEKKYYAFRGAVMEAMDDHLKTTGKPMTVDDIRRMGNRLLVKIAEPGWIGTNEVPFYQISIPKGKLDLVREDYKQEYGVYPETPEHARLHYFKRRYKEEFGGSKGSRLITE